MRSALSISRTELTRVFRDRVGLFFVFVLPFVIIFLVGTAFPADVTSLPVALLDEDGGSVGTDLTEAIEEDQVLEISEYSDESDIARDVQLGDLAAGIVIPSGTTSRVQRGETATIELLADPASSAASVVRASLEATVQQQSEVLSAALFATEQGVGDYERNMLTAFDVSTTITHTKVATTKAGEASETNPSSFAFVAPAQLTLFVFINSLAIGATLVEIRKLGLARRIYAGPTRMTSMVEGLTSSRLFFALIQSAIIIVVSLVVFDVSWGDPLAVAAIVLLWGLVSAGAGVLIGAVASTPEQTQAIGIPLAIGMSMLGGAMWPLFLVPPVMRVIGHLVPQAWAMDAWTTVLFDGGSISDIWIDLAVLAGFAAVLIALSVWLLRRALLR
ncbi:MAG: hypothetical protein JJLCMIEE_01149 [Acidimicrobiales bacterium]|nr:MAG: ABC transporter permease [Actinomycetota bacterium]MBV6508089.1 hypothetical protein [Acidimicrobiales bacterium]RIK05287.1 MAG: hypothetical protein DCC48_10420 [Acidobacteriota bacterium]